MSRLLTAEDVAEWLGVRPEFVYKLAREGRIPHLRLGRSVRFRGEALQRWIEQEEAANGRS